MLSSSSSVNWRPNGGFAFAAMLVALTIILDDSPGAGNSRTSLLRSSFMFCFASKRPSPPLETCNKRKEACEAQQGGNGCLTLARTSSHQPRAMAATERAIFLTSALSSRVSCSWPLDIKLYEAEPESIVLAYRGVVLVLVTR